jgi:phosphopantetheinyl transferase
MVMTLETMAEAALAAEGRERGAVVAKVERLRLHRWLTLDRSYLDVRVVARPLSGSEPLRRVEVELFELDEAAPAGRWSAAEATVVLAPSLPPPPRGQRLGGQSIEPRWSPERYLKELIFQGPSLRCFHRLVRMTTEGIEAEVVVPPRGQMFRGDPAPALATAASLMDGAGQVVARWIAEYWLGWDGIYPFSVEGYEQFAALPEPGERLRCVALVKNDGHVAVADVELQRPDGTVLFRYRDFRQRRFGMTAELAACIRMYEAEYRFTRPFDAGAGLLACVFDGGHHDIVRPERAIFLQTIAHTVLTADERAAWRAIPQRSPRRARWLMGRVAAKEAIRAWASERHGLSLSPVDIEIGSDERGKPIARVIGGTLSTPAPEVSISHSDTLAVAAVAEDFSVGVDIEEERDGNPRTVPEIAFAEGELADAARAGVAPIALWCAKEAAAKALGVGLLGEPRRWRVQDLACDGRAAVVTIDTLRVPVSLHVRDRAVIAVAHASHQVAALARATLRVAQSSEVKSDT